MKQRIDKFISHNTNYSRNEAKKLINKGKVKVNNGIIKDPGLIIALQDQIIVNDVIIKNNQEIYLILNKPKGYICANFDKMHQTVFDLLPEYLKSLNNIHTIGRLDLDTTGLLIITTDGNLTHKLTSPKKDLLKTYFVTVDKPLDKNLINIFKAGFNLGNFYTLPAYLTILDKFHANLKISEGKFHQVKRMFAKFGYTVTDLKRTKIGFLSLPDGLSEGKYKILNKEELIKLIFEK